MAEAGGGRGRAWGIERRRGLLSDVPSAGSEQWDTRDLQIRNINRYAISYIHFTERFRSRSPESIRKSRAIQKSKS